MCIFDHISFSLIFLHQPQPLSSLPCILVTLVHTSHPSSPFSSAHCPLFLALPAACIRIGLTHLCPALLFMHSCAASTHDQSAFILSQTKHSFQDETQVRCGQDAWVGVGEDVRSHR